MSKVKKTPACWLWTASTFRRGYGQFSIGGRGGRTVRAHRVAYQFFVGDPGDLFVLHKCDNPPCVNPKHLFLGTQADNMADRDAKGRGVVRQGEAHPNTKLTLAKVAEMRARYAKGSVSTSQLGKLFGVSQQSVHGIISGKYWRHV